VTAAPLVVVGDVLLDRDLAGRSRRLSPDAAVPVVDGVVERARPGGAGLAALLATRDGRDVILVTALGHDDGADLLRDLLAPELTLVALPWTGRTAQKVRVQADGQPLLRVDFGDEGGRVGALTGPARRAIATAGVVLVADYGRGVTARPDLRAALAAAAGTVPVVWDPHPRGSAPVPGVTLATPNLAEARGFAAGSPPDEDGAARWCAATLRHAWSARAIAVTLGRRGALLDTANGAPLLLPPPAACHGDPCGAGDRFSTAVAGALSDGEPLVGAVRHAVAAAARYVADGGPASLHTPSRPASVLAPARSVS